MSEVTISLPKQKKEELSRLSLRYGLSLADFFRRILEELSAEFPKESFEDYDNPKALRASFRKALEDWKAGRVLKKL